MSDEEDLPSLRDAGEYLARAREADRAYDDRNLLAVAFCIAADQLGYTAGWREPPPGDADADVWIIVWAQLPHGEVSWHVPRDEYLPEHLPLEEHAGYYDGYSRSEKNDRLYGWARAQR